MKHQEANLHAAFSPDSRRIITGSADQTAQLWDAATGAKAGPPLAHAGPVLYATFSRHLQLVATASFDGSARVWDATTSQPLTPLLRHTDKVWHVEFSPNSRQILTASAEGAARLWSLAQIEWPVADLQLLVQSLAGRRIDPTGVFSLLSPKVLEQNVRTLRSRHPDSLP